MVLKPAMDEQYSHVLCYSSYSSARYRKAISTEDTDDSNAVLLEEVVGMVSENVVYSPISILLQILQQRTDMPLIRAARNGRLMQTQSFTTS